MNSIYKKLAALAPTQPTKTRIWFYQHKGEAKQRLKKEGKYWYYYPPLPKKPNGLNTRMGANTLYGAKGDLRGYEGTKIWSELQ